jgi:hypoxanthine phosphoribosyltransferase
VTGQERYEEFGPSSATLTDHVAEYERDIDKVLVTSEEIQTKIQLLGEEITGDYRGEDLLLIGVLKGAFVVMADLSRHIRLPLQFDFMAVSSYGASTKTSGVVRILKDLDHEIQGRHVLVVEDIVDSGLTLAYLLKNLRSRRPASLEVATLLHKTEVQQVPVEVRYVGAKGSNLERGPRRADCARWGASHATGGATPEGLLPCRSAAGLPDRISGSRRALDARQRRPAIPVMPGGDVEALVRRGDLS